MRNTANLNHPIRTARLRAKLTQQALADILGVDQSTISCWESGTKLPTPGMAVRLKDALRGLTLDKISGQAA